MPTSLFLAITAAATLTATATACDPDGAYADPGASRTAVLSRVNEERAKVGCAAVQADASLDALAQAHSDDMANRKFFDHTNPDGKTASDRAKEARVQNWAGENIVRGPATTDAAMESWMDSPGHRALILNCDYTRVGVGVNETTGGSDPSLSGPWWTQEFGT